MSEAAAARRPDVSAPIVVIKGLSKTFGRSAAQTPAIENISLSIQRSEFVSLIGPSGCGKSTLLNVIAGLVQPDRGEVSFDGSAIDGPNRRVGYMTQDDALLAWRNVLANIALPLEIKGVARQERERRAREILERVGLAGFERHLPAQLSGGMRKRVSLARTLVYQPEFLLLDEPFGALDAQTRIVIQRELHRIVSEFNLTVVLVTHDLHEAIALSHRILVFSRGPGRIIDSLWVPQTPGRDLSERGRSDEELYRHLWRRLAGEQETPHA